MTPATPIRCPLCGGPVERVRVEDGGRIEEPMDRRIHHQRSAASATDSASSLSCLLALRVVRGVVFVSITDAPIDAVARRFTTILRGWLTRDEWTAMVAANRAETDPRICHSHDYCDANMAMLEAFDAYGDIDVDDDDHVRIWNAAWEAAMPTLRGDVSAPRRAKEGR